MAFGTPLPSVNKTVRSSLRSGWQPTTVTEGLGSPPPCPWQTPRRTALAEACPRLRSNNSSKSCRSQGCSPPAGRGNGQRRVQPKTYVCACRGIDRKPASMAPAPNGAEAPGACNGRLISTLPLRPFRSKGDWGGDSHASPRLGLRRCKPTARLAASSRCAYVRAQGDASFARR